MSHPSGNRFKLSGELEVIVIGGGGACPTIDNGERVVVLDPRAIIRERASGELVYHPSMVTEKLARGRASGLANISRGGRGDDPRRTARLSELGRVALREARRQAHEGAVLRHDGAAGELDGPAGRGRRSSTAAAFARAESDGVGFVFTADDPFAGVDLDDCVGDAQRLHPAAAEIVERLASYTELSPSGDRRPRHCARRAHRPGPQPDQQDAVGRRVRGLRPRPLLHR